MSNMMQKLLNRPDSRGTKEAEPLRAPKSNKENPEDKNTDNTEAATSKETSTVQGSADSLRKAKAADNTESVDKSAVASVFCEGLRVEGELQASENLIISGEMVGVIQHDGELLTVGVTGNVEAEVNARNLLVEGALKGDMNCTESITITQTAIVSGNIRTARLSIADGARFSGKIDMN